MLAADADADARVLVFTKTTGYRHDSIPAGVAALSRMGFAVDATDHFPTSRLSRYEAVVFVSTTGDPLPRASQRRALRAYMAHGGGFLGIHAAADAGYSWPWYRRLVGATFKHHAPGTPSAVVSVVDRSSEATRGLPRAWTRMDEWYEFHDDPRGRVHVLATVHGHPIAWCRRFGGGRSVYTGMGHTTASYSEPRFLLHLRGALRMAAGRASFNCGVSGAAVR
ncbi:ThuA domain-containing protein [Candidatus Solirubrobacter pratensis]|uniref:ThuA domain-containing protein n=1 Tax=Candidatus Solirubrobacter pratensis TaxID=1298857 RepID=UPI0006845516|nr:ThuA domain-containing protein [Candidatus Solirubrobacter pratensis]